MNPLLKELGHFWKHWTINIRPLTGQKEIEPFSTARRQSPTRERTDQPQGGTVKLIDVPPLL